MFAIEISFGPAHQWRHGYWYVFYTFKNGEKQGDNKSVEYFSRQLCVMCDFCIEKERKWDEGENERGRNRERRLRAANPKSLFLRFCRTWTKRYLITSQTRVKRVSRIHHRTILLRMVRWCIRLTRLTLVCEVIVMCEVKVTNTDVFLCACMYGSTILTKIRQWGLIG